MAKDKSQYPKMLYRDDDKHDAIAVFGKPVFYTIVADEKAEAEAKKNGFRNEVYAPKKAAKVEK